MYYCPNCKNDVKGKKWTPGSFIVEIILWLLFILPGLFFSLWRLSKRKTICEICRYEFIIKKK